MALLLTSSVALVATSQELPKVTKGYQRLPKVTKGLAQLDSAWLSLAQSIIFFCSSRFD